MEQASLVTEPLVEDRRVYERLTARFPIKLKDSRHDYGVEFLMRDISAGGLKLLSREKLYLNDFLSLLVQLPDDQEPLNLNGQVVWVRPAGPHAWDVGLQFHKIDYLRLHRFLKFHSS